MALKILVLAVSLVGILACGTLTARLATDSAALSAHPDCGIYENPVNASYQAGLRLVRFDAEYESAQLAEKCYDAGEGADGCGFFSQRSIPYSTTDAPCPFRDQTMCIDGGSRIVRFSTGPVDARAVGINTPLTMQFSRDTTCSPIVVNETFVEAKNLNGSLVYYYYYGGVTATGAYPLTHITMNPDEVERPQFYQVK